MLNYNEITKKRFIVHASEPYEVIDSHVFRKQQRKPVNQTKLKNLISGKVIEHSFHQSDKAEEADIEKKQVKYLYNNRGEYWFSDLGNPSDRFSVNEEIVPAGFKFIKENKVVEILTWNEKIIGFNLPIKVKLEVTDAPPAVKGNTAQGATKEVLLETGVKIQVPLFVNSGDIIEINTEKEEYSGRAEKISWK